MTKNLPYSKEMAISVARQYKHKSDFQRENFSLYKWALRRGYWHEMTSHMEVKPHQNVKWSHKSILEEAKKYTHKKDFILLSNGAAAAARRLGIITEVCLHMDRRITADEFSMFGRICRVCKERKYGDDFPPNSSSCRKCESQRGLEYAAKNVAWKRSTTAKRRAMKKNATPKWLTKSMQKEIISIYKEAESRSKIEGVEYEVDHIIPLSGKNVCGLHVPWNLRVITKEENRRKGFKLLDGYATSTISGKGNRSDDGACSAQR